MAKNVPILTQRKKKKKRRGDGAPCDDERGRLVAARMQSTEGIPSQSQHAARKGEDRKNPPLRINPGNPTGGDA